MDRTQILAKGEITLVQEKRELWFLFATHRLIVLNTFVKFHPNLITGSKVIARTRISVHLHSIDPQIKTFNIEEEITL